MTETSPVFTFAALPMGGGGDDPVTPSQHKRVRTDDNLCDKLEAIQVTSSEPASPILNSVSPSMSYASMLLNPMSNYGSAATDDFDTTDEDCTYDIGNEVPSVCFSSRLKDKLNLKWRCAVIIKLVGKPNSSNALKFMSDSLKRKWKLQGPWQLIDLPNGYFVVKFHLHEDMNIALCGGPWIIAGQTLVVQQWKPDFDPFVSEITNMAVWVRFVGLPLRFYEEFPMRKIGHLIGNVVKVDKLTLAQVRGQFARVCVEVDLQKPLVPFVDVEGCRYGVVYEGISMICFNCGCFGHVRDTCAYKNVNGKTATDVHSEPTPTKASDDIAMSMAADPPPRITKSNTPVNSQANGHGPWMLMSYKNKKRISTANVHTQDRVASGSRFSILESNEVDNNGDAIEDSGADMITKASLHVDNEPKIVSLWKSLQQKINDKDSAEPKTNSQDTVASLKATPSSSVKSKTSHPMKDITNGKSSGIGDTPSKARRNGLGTKMLKDAGPGAKSFSIFVPGLPTLLKSTAPPAPVANTSASFGHCPPEISSNFRFAGGGSSSGSSYNAQASSDFVTATFDKAAVIPMVVQSLNSSDDEATLCANMSSSLEESMIVS